MAESDPQTPTYHVSMWDQPVPTYVCLLCHASGLTLDEVAAHLASLHTAAAVPTPMIPSLLKMREEDDARLATLAAAAIAEVVPATEEDATDG